MDNEAKRRAPSTAKETWESHPKERENRKMKKNKLNKISSINFTFHVCRNYSRTK